MKEILSRVNDRFERVPFLSLSPTSTTLYYRTFDKKECEFTRPRRFLHDGIEVDAQPPVFKEHQGDLSSKAKRSLTRSVNMMLCGVDERLLLESKGTDKITFITLTLASSQIKAFHRDSVDFWADDKQIKRECFNQLLTELKELKGVTSYVWKAEKQINGNLHFHLLIDKKICWEWLRERWNALQNKFGFIDRYSEKMRVLTKDEYVSMRLKEYKNPTDKQLLQINKAWTEGVKCNWTNPNSTDIQTLKNIKNVSGYIAKYMSKDKGHDAKKTAEYQCQLTKEYELSPLVIKDMYTIKGRIWQCSRHISKSRHCVTFAEPEYGAELSVMVEKENLKVFEDESVEDKKEGRFITFCHSFKQLNIYCKSIYEVFVSHVKKFFQGLADYGRCFARSTDVAGCLSDVFVFKNPQLSLSFI